MRFHVMLASLVLLGACVAAPVAVDSVSPVAVVEAPHVAEARAAIRSFVDKNEFSGAVLVAQNGKAIYREGFGLANREHGVPVTPDTIFRLGSITKQFTAASILQLAEAGKLSIDDPVSKYYAKAPATWKDITIKHLLTHRSGIPSYTGLPDFFSKLAGADKTPEEIVELTASMPLEFPPGSKYAYDNTGYVLLGYVIEKVTGGTYADYLQAHIFGPLGMKRSGYDVSSVILPGRAQGYGITDGVWQNANYLSMTLPHAAGSLYSTVDDLLIWENALFGGKVMSAASLTQMTADYGNNYGFGIGSRDFQGHVERSHSGGINGFSTNMAYYPNDSGLNVIVLSNLETARSGGITNALARLWLGLPEPPPPPPIVAVTVAPAILDRYVGVYELMPKFNITITRTDAGLTAQATGQGAFPLTATSDTEFQFQQAGLRIVFPAGDGPAKSFTLFQGGERQATRIAGN